MKKIAISTAAVAMLAVALVLTPRMANASTAKDTYKKMCAVLASAVKDGELSLNISSDSKGTISVSGTLDGNPLPADFPLDITSSVNGNIIDVFVTANLSPENYSKIEYGKDKNTLELTPKNDPKSKTEIVLDPKSMKPKSWVRQWQESNGQWHEIAKGNSSPKWSTTAAGAKSDSTINVHVKMNVGGTATITASGNGH